MELGQSTGAIVRLEVLLLPARTLHDYDLATALKLQASLRRYGQLRPVLVRRSAGGALAVVEGRGVVEALRALGREHVWVLDVGQLSDADAGLLAAATLVGFDVDYAAVAALMAGLQDLGATAETLSSATPFTPERIRHFATLVKFDWSQFRPDDRHPRIDWESEVALEEPAETALVPVHAEPSPETVAAVEHALETEPPEAVVTALRRAVVKGRKVHANQAALF
jgi:hypothetical protein